MYFSAGLSLHGLVVCVLVRVVVYFERGGLQRFCNLSHTSVPEQQRSIQAKTKRTFARRASSIGVMDGDIVDIADMHRFPATAILVGNIHVLCCLGRWGRSKGTNEEEPMDGGGGGCRLVLSREQM